MKEKKLKSLKNNLLEIYGSANIWTGFYIIWTPVMKKLIPAYKKIINLWPEAATVVVL